MKMYGLELVTIQLVITRVWLEELTFLFRVRYSPSDDWRGSDRRGASCDFAHLANHCRKPAAYENLPATRNKTKDSNEYLALFGTTFAQP